MRVIFESVRQSLPQTEQDCRMFIRGALWMFWFFIVALIVATYLGMRATGHL